MKGTKGKSVLNEIPERVTEPVNAKARQAARSRAQHRAVRELVHLNQEEYDQLYAAALKDELEAIGEPLVLRRGRHT